ncbi:hypothetical protein OEA41_005689 [Lepraria neglecta]|uniref:Uncharacterized protein n=1 Tax=Lepraria neglecta TaxID=209136 RepID=A0AAD9Z7Q1_9LECA|nr:hypothetical protein OEA41_005689 [Lepraria neglecta]
MTVLLDMVVVMGPAHRPATAAVVDQVLTLGSVTGVILPPSLLENLCREPSMLEHLRKIKYVHYAGADLNKATGDAISQHVKLVSALGSTEAGPYYVRIHDEPEWNYHRFCPSIGLDFEHRTKELYEAVFRRKGGLERWQQVFMVYPHLDRFPTNDLMVRYPTKSDLWAFAGRSDDLVTLSHGNSLPASHMEGTICNHSDVRAAIIGGHGRERPFLILDLVRDRLPANIPQQDKDVIDEVWPVVNKANEGCIDIVRLTKESTILATPANPFVWTAKGTVMRRVTIELYQDEVSGLYRDSGRE